MPWETPRVLAEPVLLTQVQQLKATLRWRTLPEHSRSLAEAGLADQKSFDRAQAFPLALAATRARQLAAQDLETEL